MHDARNTALCAFVPSVYFVCAWRYPTLQPRNKSRSFRLVCREQEIPMALELLQREEITPRQEPFSPHAYSTETGTEGLGASLAAEFGLIYIQDRSSMLPPLALDSAFAGGLRGKRVLDMCSSPGGKSGFLAQLTGPEGCVLANEPNPERLATLRRNLQRLNLLNAATCHYPGEALPLPDACLEAILLDPPCSGWGTVEKHPRVKKLWKGDKILPLVKLQRRLLAEAARLLVPGGRMTYSTCTTNPAENEEQLAWAQQELGLQLLPLEPFPGFSFEQPTLAEAAGSLRVDGQQSEAQGFFISLLAKPGEPGLAPESFSGTFPPMGEELDPGLFAEQGADTAPLACGRPARFGERVFLLHEHLLDLLPENFRWQGFPLGKYGKAGLRMHPRLRLLLPEPGARPAGTPLCLEEIAPIRALLSGQSHDLNIEKKSSGLTGLYFNSLPLAWLNVKGRRAIWSDR